ncbi:MAG: hypothetical protein JSV80_11480 [Acidobacteriota bacterium]|nr:MAG: hypothetical protein JSV80_11480 [Acidobacteriota bacterium]
MAKEDIVDLSDEKHRQCVFITRYLRAYFRDGKFYVATLDMTSLKNNLIEKLKQQLSVPDGSVDYDKLVSEIFSQFNFDESDDQPIFGKIGTTGFVTRGGKDFRGPVVEATIDPIADRPVTVSKLDYVAVGSDLIREVLHAIFDASDGIPAVSTAIGVGLPESYRLRVNVGQETHVDEEEFRKVEEWAGTVEGITSAAVGRLVRGAGWASLDNEAVASMIETSVGVAARKAAEKLIWCRYACELEDLYDTEMARKAGVDDISLAGGRQIVLRIAVDGPPAPLASERDPWRPPSTR